MLYYALGSERCVNKMAKLDYYKKLTHPKAGPGRPPDLFPDAEWVEGPFCTMDEEIVTIDARGQMSCGHYVCDYCQEIIDKPTPGTREDECLCQACAG